MFIPVGEFSQGKLGTLVAGNELTQQNIWQVDKDASGRVTKEKLFGVQVSLAVGSLLTNSTCH